ncbi:MAG TPA: glycosyltransferase [Candidatus Saccharimonadales bacterium]|nr:glycosyltransferase [Candidatus Saccharimonadales bacterium]
MQNAKLRVALVCDWLTGVGGAERVVLELHRLYPDAPIYTSQYNPKKIDWFADADVRTGWLQKLPAGLKKFLPILRAWYFSHLDLSGYDLVISSSGAEAKGVTTGPRSMHICYTHAPTHYYWSRYDDYMARPGFGRLDFLARLGLKLLVGPMRRWDRKAAQAPDFIIANSDHTKEQIKKYYGRDAAVIHPPVDIERFKLPTTNYQLEPRRGFITAGRQTPYKRIDLAVKACSQLGLPLVVIGSGPDHRRLKAMAGKSVTFLRGKSDEEVAHYFKTSQAFIFPGLDDFGVVAVEALAAGTPVIAYQAGGALDYIEPGKNGLFFSEQTVASLTASLQKFNPDSFNHSAIQKSASQFSTQNFHDKMTKFINSHQTTNT